MYGTYGTAHPVHGTATARQRRTPIPADGIGPTTIITTIASTYYIVGSEYTHVGGLIRQTCRAWGERPSDRLSNGDRPLDKYGADLAPYESCLLAQRSSM